MAPDAPERLRSALLAARERSERMAGAWRTSPAVRRTVAALAPAGVDVTIARAGALLADAGLVAELLAPLIEALVEEPMLEPPLRVRRDERQIGAVLLETPDARLGASIVRLMEAVPVTVVASGSIAVTRYHRAGAATLHRWRVDAVDRRFSAAEAMAAQPLAPAPLNDGDVRVHDGRTEAQLLTGHGVVASVTVLLKRARAPLTRAYRTRDGALLRSATTDESASRAAMLRTLLRVARRTDASALFEEATHDAAFHTRWEAMREWLALGAGAAHPRLTAMAAGDPHPEVRAAAAATLALIEERLRCPA